MGWTLRGRATTTRAIRAATRRSRVPLKELAARCGLNQKTVAKRPERSRRHDRRRPAGRRQVADPL